LCQDVCRLEKQLALKVKGKNMSGQFKFLFTPLKIGQVTVPNRISFSAHMTNFAVNGLPSERHLYYCAERAKGGAGLIIT